MTLTTQKFSQGMSTQDYIEQIKVNKQPFLEIYQAVEIPAETQQFFDSLPQPLKLAVFTSDWCGDALSTTPTILRLADSSENLSLEVFNRDEELELTNSFLPEHRAGTVPVFVVFDQDMGEITRFIETSRQLVPRIDAMDERIAAEVAGEGENAPAAGRGKRTAFRVAHAKEWGEVILREFTQLVSDGLALPPTQRPTEGGTEWPPPQG
jgi:thiol-disulfide isomerase/thioredoxin